MTVSSKSQTFILSSFLSKILPTEGNIFVSARKQQQQQNISLAKPKESHPHYHDRTIAGSIVVHYPFFSSFFWGGGGGGYSYCLRLFLVSCFFQIYLLYFVFTGSNFSALYISTPPPPPITHKRATIHKKSLSLNNPFMLKSTLRNYRLYL